MRNEIKFEEDKCYKIFLNEIKGKICKEHTTFWIFIQNLRK